MYTFFLNNWQFPFTPGKLTLKIKGKNKTLTLVNDGEINFLKSPGLTEISFEATFPMTGGYSFTTGDQKPDYYLSKLEALMTGLKPCQFIVSRIAPNGKLLYNSNIKVSLEDYNVVEDAKSGPDVTVAIRLLQYRDFVTKTIVLKEPAVQATRPAESAPAAKTHKVVKGDTLWAIAKKYYGNGAQYNKIFETNKNILKNPNLIYPGQVLTIP